MFVPLFPFPVPIPHIGEQLLPLNRPALPCTACTAHRAYSSFSLNKGKGIGSPLCRAAPRGCRRPCIPSTNTARAEGGGIQGGPPPCAGGPGTRRSLAYLCLLSLREKVGRGAGRSARSLRVKARSDDLLPGGTAPSHRQAGVQGGAPTYHGAQGPPPLQKALGDASPP